MKQINTLIFLILAVFLFSCVKNRQNQYVVKYDTGITGQARLKFNINSAKINNPTMLIKIDNVVVSNLLTARTPFPGGGYNTGGSNYADFLGVAPGSREINIAIPKARTSTDSILIYKGNLNLESAKYYTLHVTDTADKVKTLLVEENVDNSFVPKPGFRFINLMPNVPSVDLYYGPFKIASGINFLNITPEFTLDSINTAFAWTVREANATANLATYTSASTVLNNTKYTIFATGYKGIPGTTDVRRPFVSFFMVSKQP
ncbi:MAG TPA: hypothetical protein PK110_05520 [Niabella sp.]|nr:DUF4397 domain-containing protein [Chitinophagaceae bacterium]HRO84265.1 hypothetical protein [Niabella sp.]HUN02216.1 hypothetical protein [Niabella sp.]